MSPINDCISTLVSIANGTYAGEPVEETVSAPAPDVVIDAIEILRDAFPVDAHDRTWKGSVRKEFSDEWRPAFTPQEIVNLAPPARFPMRVVNGEQGLFASRWQLEQIGRAMALSSWYKLEGARNNVAIITHARDEKRIRVNFNNNLAQRWHKGRWERHEISAGLVIERDKQPNVFWVSGDTYPLRVALQKAGGVWKGWRQSYLFMNAVPEWVTRCQAEPMLSKFHIVAACLSGNTMLLNLNGMDKHEARQIITEAYRKEVWRLVGYDWRDYPHINL